MHLAAGVAGQDKKGLNEERGALGAFPLFLSMADTRQDNMAHYSSTLLRYGDGIIGRPCYWLTATPSDQLAGPSSKLTFPTRFASLCESKSSFVLTTLTGQ